MVVTKQAQNSDPKDRIKHAEDRDLMPCLATLQPHDYSQALVVLEMLSKH